MYPFLFSFPLRVLPSNLATFDGLQGTFQVLDAWGNGLSSYIVCFDDGGLVDASNLLDASTNFSLMSFEGYTARGFPLLAAIYAISSARPSADGIARAWLDDDDADTFAANIGA